MQAQIGLECPIHPNRAAELVCLLPKCTESSRILCAECNHWGSHENHKSSLLKLGKISSSSDGSSLNHLKKLFLEKSHFQGVWPSMKEIFQFFGRLEKEILKELHRVRDGVIEAAQIRENVLGDIQNELLFSEARISTMLESQEIMQMSKNSSRDSADMSELEIDGSYEKYGVDTSQRRTIESNSEINNNSNIRSNSVASNLLSCEISTELNSLSDNCTEVLIETDIQIHQILSQSQLQFQQFTEQVSSFLRNNFPEKGQQTMGGSNDSKSTLEQILKNNYTEDIFRNKLKFMKACDFFSNIGYQSCIAIDSIEGLQLLKKVSGYLCHEFEESQHQTHFDMFDSTETESGHSKLQFLSNSDQQGQSQCNLFNSDESHSYYQSSPCLPLNIRSESSPTYSFPPLLLPQKQQSNSYQITQNSWQKGYFFSAFLDNKSLGDSLFLSEIPRQLIQMRYIHNIHLDFNNNSLSTICYVSLFESLMRFYQLEHLDLRFNNNYSPEAPAVEALSQLLLSQQSSLKLLCITMKQLKHSLKRPNSLCVSSSPSSPLDTSCSSVSSCQQQQNQYSNNHLRTPEYPSEQQSQYFLNSTLKPTRSPFRTTPQSSQFTQAGDMLIKIINTLTNLKSLEVLYLDFSTNILESSLVFSPSLDVSNLKVLHFSLNQTKLPPQQALHLLFALNKRSTPLNYCKLFLKDNDYTFQQQRTISGQFQKVQANSKNFDLFF